MISSHVRPVVTVLAFMAGALSCSTGTRAPAGEPRQVWMDPAWQAPATPAGSATAATPATPGTPGTPGTPAPQPNPRAIVWFDRQLLGPGDSYARFVESHGAAKRHALRRLVVDSLKRLSDASWKRARGRVEELEREGVVTSCRRSWIVNAITCELPSGDPAPLATIPGAARVFQTSPRALPPVPAKPEPVVPPDAGGAYHPDPGHAAWNARMLGVDRVWSELGLTGRGVLQVIHDYGWSFRPALVRATLWSNPGEIPGNGKDDDHDGYVDDVHGFDFDFDTDNLGSPTPLLPGGLTHGDLTAAFAAGRDMEDSAVVVGVAPGSRWAAVIEIFGMEEAVQWAIEHGADTYSMSFSIPGLGELRAHLRKIMEQGALAGLFFVSGAGNFADSTRPNFAPIPVQMRFPEDIPLAVLGVSGVGRDGRRPFFSSQGPVEWKTSEYNEGEVAKPDLATVNTNLLGIDSVGRAFVPGPRGWSGNSFAAPHLAGVLALMLEADPELTPWRARAILMRTAHDAEAPGFDPQTGAGVVDAYAAVKEVLRSAKAR